MALVSPTVYVSQVAFGSSTYDKTLGGPMSFRVQRGGRDLEDRTGNSVYPTSVIPVDVNIRSFLTMREIKQTIAQGTSGTLIATLQLKGGSTQTMTLGTAVLCNIRMTQDRAELGNVEFEFAHESVDGTSAPIS